MPEPFFTRDSIEKALDRAHVREAARTAAREAGGDEFTDLAARTQRLDRKMNVALALAYISSLLTFGILVLLLAR